jgi:hypothetical protein
MQSIQNRPMEMQFASEIEKDKMDLLWLAQQVSLNEGHAFTSSILQRLIGAPKGDWAEAERTLDRGALELRRAWLAKAHRPGDTTLKSPCDGERAHVPGSGTVDFGYERDLDVSLLEDRRGYLQAVAGWGADLVLCRSGQAALSAILHYAVQRWGRTGRLKISHAGAYFETKSLLDVWSPLAIEQRPPLADDEVDVLLWEPVYCDGQFDTPKAEAMPRARRIVVIDSTMVGPDYDLSPWLRPGSEAHACGTLIAFSSGLKLDQAGLELANVGIIRIFTRENTSQTASAVATHLKRIRGLIGCGLTLDEMSALSAPWFLDRGYAGRYSGTLFSNNAALALSVGNNSEIFADRCHPSLADASATAPFCALQLRGNQHIGAYRRLLNLVEAAATKRDLVVAKGGSFGFRGHRFELIEPDPAQGRPFLRIAMGWRGGYTCTGLCDLFGEMANCRSLANLDRVCRS